MKRVIFVVAAMLLGGMAIAQTEKGSKVLGGSIGIGGRSSTNEDDYVSGTDYKSKDVRKDLDVGANIGFFVKDNFCIGLGIGNDYTRIKNNWNEAEGDFDFKRNWNTVNGNIFLKKYIPVANKLFFTAGGNINVGILSGESQYSASLDQKYKDTGLDLGASANIGFTYFVNKHLGLSTTLGSLNYTFSKTKSTYNSVSLHRETVTNSSYLQSNTFISSLSIGLNYFF